MCAQTQAAAVRTAVRSAALAFVAEQKALPALPPAAAPEQREFVSGEVACLLHVSAATRAGRLEQALRVMAFPRLMAALEQGLLGVGHAPALLAEVGHLDAAHATAVIDAALDGPLDADGRLDATPSPLRSTARRAAITLDPELARRRHEAARSSQDQRTLWQGTDPQAAPQAPLITPMRGPRVTQTRTQGPRMSGRDPCRRWRRVLTRQPAEQPGPGPTLGATTSSSTRLLRERWDSGAAG